MSDEEPYTPEMLWHCEEGEEEEDPHHDVECVAPEQHSMKLILMVNRSVRNQSSFTSSVVLTKTISVL